MNPVVLEFANGRTWFYGLVLCALTVVMLASGVRHSRIIWHIFGWVGIIFVLLSSTPVPIAVYLVWIAAYIAAIYTLRTGATKSRTRIIVCGAFVVLSVALFAAELRWHLAPAIPPITGDNLYVLGDSIAIGADTEEQNWPNILARELGMNVKNLSSGGAKGSTARAKTNLIDSPDAVIVIEIGGNDQFYKTPIDEFTRDLDALLAAVKKTDRTVFMLEIPLIPGNNRYGAAQRSLATKHAVTLIPKRYLASAFRVFGATTDGLHFSNAGHAARAKTLATLLKPARIQR